MIVGVDIGTGSLKVVVVDERMDVRGAASSRYRTDFPRPGWAEQDPAQWERALGPAVVAALAAAEATSGQVVGLGVAGQIDGCLAVDGGGKALGPCLIWMDRRAQAETDDIPADLIRRKTGTILDAGHMAAKIRWLKRHRPECRRARFHQVVSYLVERLTGEYVIDRALASTTMVGLLDRKEYDAELLALFEISPRELPRIAEAASPAGRLTAAGAALTGLPQGIPVAVGTGDDFATPLGAGLVSPGRVAAVLGTAEVVGALDRRAVIDDVNLLETHAYPAGAFFIENPGWLSGGAVAWLVEILGLADPPGLDELAAGVPPGAEGVTFLPALSGAMTPRWNAAMRGGFHGLAAAHGRRHLARALLEGCAFALRDVVDRLSAMHVATDSILLLGGGARSRIWAQVRADVLGRSVYVPSRIDTSPVGAAMLAAVAGGSIADLTEAAELVGGGGTTLDPDRDRTAAYDDAYAAYRRLFDALEPLSP